MQAWITVAGTLISTVGDPEELLIQIWISVTKFLPASFLWSLWFTVVIIDIWTVQWWLFCLEKNFKGGNHRLQWTYTTAVEVNERTSG